MRFLVLSILVVLFYSCDVGEKDTTEKEEDLFVADTILANPVYPPFQDSIIVKGMKSAGLCAVDDSLIPPCNHKFFRAYQIGPDIPLHQAFLLDVRLGAYPGVLSKKVIHVENMGNRWKIKNDYLGALLELRTSRSGKYDLVIRYRSMGDAVVVRHSWSDEEGAFYPVEVEEINGFFIKEEYKDSVNTLFLKEFPWGF